MWAAPVAVLFAVWVWLVFSSGGFLPRQWLLPSLFLGLLGLILSLLAAYPRRPRQLSSVLLGLFACFSLWVAFSGLWADSGSRAWTESGRTFTYLAVFGLAAVYLTDAGARRIFRYLVIGSGLFLLLACIWKLWSSQDLAPLFSGNRFSYPTTYPNNTAALFLIVFWPLVWLAAGPEERAPVRGVALGVATGLLGLAIMTQSRGALWSLGISAVVMFVLSPARLRTLLYLVVPGLLMVYEFPNLNTYWQKGIQGVDGAFGARTLLVASLTAGFVGMILALLERWVSVSRRMKAIFGSVLLAGLIAAVVYGSVVVTADQGGPFKWLSHNWTQFTNPAPETASGTGASAGPSSRFTVVDSNGRIDIWRVAWAEFKAEPLKGVGAGNFVFKYDLLRSSEISKPEHPHSLFLQVLAETGIVGGVLFVGSLLFGLAALVWPRCTAGWRKARQTWLRPAKPVNDRLCNPRWGADPRAYGWEMALLAALAYWLVHGNIEWLWQMVGVSLPAFLLLAAAVAQVDARAELVWPRLSRRLRIAVPERVTRWQVQPPGLLSPVFRLLLTILSLLVMITAGTPYLVLRYEESALALARTDPVRAVARAGSAHWLRPSDPSPYLTQATIYDNSAREALQSNATDSAGAVLDNLALEIQACDRAAAVDPADWSLRYQAGVATLNFLLASEYTAGRGPTVNIASSIPRIPGLADWSGLAVTGVTPPGPGMSTGSLAQDESTRTIATYYRALAPEALVSAALDRLLQAKSRNPLATQTGEAAALVERVVTQ